MSIVMNVELSEKTLNARNKTHRRRHTERNRVMTKTFYHQAARQQDTEAALEIDAWARRAVGANGFGDF